MRGRLYLWKMLCSVSRLLPEDTGFAGTVGKVRQDHGAEGVREVGPSEECALSKESRGSGRGWDPGPGASGFRACGKLSCGQSVETGDSFLAAGGKTFGEG